MTGSTGTPPVEPFGCFREAISALHDVVISDLRFKVRDKSAYEAYLAEQKEREDVIRRTAYQAAKQELESRRAASGRGGSDVSG